MKSLEVTDEQYAFIQQLREEISEQVVGRYGYVRERDAVQFLIDNVDGGLEVEGDFSVDDGADLAYDEDSEDLEDGEDLEDSEDLEDGGDLEDSEDLEDGGDLEDSEDLEDGEPGSEDGGEADDGSADDDDMLDRMMSLLDTHDDKWEESPSSDHRYRVTLPDDSTEDVQTKDDVRALLFQNY